MWTVLKNEPEYTPLTQPPLSWPEKGLKTSTSFLPSFLRQVGRGGRVGRLSGQTRRRQRALLLYPCLAPHAGFIAARNAVDRGKEKAVDWSTEGRGPTGASRQKKRAAAAAAAHLSISAAPLPATLVIIIIVLGGIVILGGAVIIIILGGVIVIVILGGGVIVILGAIIILLRG